jgi:hypothetical protein
MTHFDRQMFEMMDQIEAQLESIDFAKTASYAFLTTFNAELAHLLNNKAEADRVTSLMKIDINPAANLDTMEAMGKRWAEIIAKVVSKESFKNAPEYVQKAALGSMSFTYNT